MALGSYSLVRYSDHLSDQRINLGVIVWHPNDGFRFRITPALDRVHAIDPRLLVQPLRLQLETIKDELSSAKGQDTLANLSRLFKEGLEVASPYPARISSAEETLEHLYQMLVTPVEEIRRASSQHQFEKRMKTVLREIATTHKAKYEDIGNRRIGDLLVNVGVRTAIDQRKILWHALSLQSVDHPERQLAFAKATAMDINFLGRAAEYKGHSQYVTIQRPKPSASERFRDSVAWLENTADKVWVVNDADGLSKLFEKVLR